MADAQKLLLLFDRPKEPVFFTKGDQDAVFDIPNNYLVSFIHLFMCFCILSNRRAIYRSYLKIVLNNLFGDFRGVWFQGGLLVDIITSQLHQPVALFLDQIEKLENSLKRVTHAKKAYNC